MGNKAAEETAQRGVSGAWSGGAGGQRTLAPAPKSPAAPNDKSSVQYFPSAAPQAPIGEAEAPPCSRIDLSLATLLVAPTASCPVP